MQPALGGWWDSVVIHTQNLQYNMKHVFKTANISLLKEKKVEQKMWQMN